MAVESIVIGIAFVVSCVVLYSPVAKVVRKMLDNYKEDISLKVESRLNDKEKYEKLLSDAIAEHNNLDKEVGEIINSAKERALSMEKSATEESQKLFDNKIKAVREGLVAYTEHAIQDIRKECVEVAFATVKKFASDTFDSDIDQQKVLDSMCKEMKENLN